MTYTYLKCVFTIIVLWNYILDVHGMPDIGNNLNRWFTDSFHGLIDEHVYVSDNPCIFHFVKTLIPTCGISYSEPNKYRDLCTEQCCKALVFPNIYGCSSEWLDISNAIIQQIQLDITHNCTNTCSTQSLCPFSVQTTDTPCSAIECQNYLTSGIRNSTCDTLMSEHCNEIGCIHPYEDFSIHSCISNFLNYTRIDKYCFDFLQVILGIEDRADAHITDKCFTVSKDGDMYSINNCFADTKLLKTTESVEYVIIGSFFVMFQILNFYIVVNEIKYRRT